jgi:hypothetical protein
MQNASALHFSHLRHHADVNDAMPAFQGGLRLSVMYPHEIRPNLCLREILSMPHMTKLRKLAKDYKRTNAWRTPESAAIQESWLNPCCIRFGYLAALIGFTPLQKKFFPRPIWLSSVFSF